MNLRLCHSYWSLPAHKQRWGIKEQMIPNIWLAATSVAFAKKNGAEIVLHSDYEGKELLNWLPYDSIYLTLEKHCFNPVFWASGKILAQEAEPSGTIHIDFDVFIKRSGTIKINRFYDSDLLIQNEEKEMGVYKENIELVAYALNESNNEVLLSVLDITRNSAYNCGVIGFNNKKLKEHYIKGYLDMYHTIVNNKICMEKVKENNTLCLDLVLEQYWLQSIAVSYNAHVYSLLRNEHIQEDAEKNYYTHVIGAGKYQKTIQNEVKKLLKKIDTALYHKCLDFTNKLI